MKTIIEKTGIGCILLLCLMISFTACGKDSIVDNKVYIPQNSVSNEQELLVKSIPITGEELFASYQNLITKEDTDRIIASISPDKKKIIFLDKLAPLDQFKIKGPIFNQAEIVEYDVEKKTNTVIGSNMIKSAKWNSTSDNLAYIASDDRVYLYDSIKKQTVKEPTGTEISSIEWSNDGTKIYLSAKVSHSNLIYYPGSNTTNRSREMENEVFVAGRLDENYKIILKKDVPDAYINGNKDEKLKYAQENLYIANKENKALKQLKYGKIVGVYKRSLLLTGADGFNLYYYKDFEQKEPIRVSQEYIYDAGFVEGGNFIFTNATEDVDANYFDLSYASQNGSIIKKSKSLSSKIYIMPDGKKAIGNLNYPKITFDNGMNVVSESGPMEPKFTAEDESVFKTLRGAMSLYYNMSRDPNKKTDFSAYFADSQNPIQSALYEVTNKQAIVNSSLTKVLDSKTIEKDKRIQYAIEITLNNKKPGAAFDVPAIDYYKVQNEERAQVALSVKYSGYSFSYFGSSAGLTLELIKKDGKWYVTGICTHPRSVVAKDARARAEKLVQEIKQTGSYGGVLKGKNVNVGQVQFWQMSDPTLSENVESSNYCLVYLHVNDNNAEHVYKMTMKKDGKTWTAADVRENTTYGLF